MMRGWETSRRAECHGTLERHGVLHSLRRTVYILWRLTASPWQDRWGRPAIMVSPSTPVPGRTACATC